MKPPEHFFHVSTNSNTFSTNGKDLCSEHINDFCATFAAICSMCPLKVPLSELIIKKFQISKASTNGYQSNAETDIKFLRQTTQCLCAEVCRLWKFPVCLHTVKEAWREILCKCIDSLTDADIIIRFPTCNLEQVSKLGGSRVETCARERSDKVNRAALMFASIGHDDPDAEAIGIRLQKDKLKDAQGPNFMCKNLWTFCRDLGLAMKQISTTFQEIKAEEKDLIAVIGKTLLDNNENEVSPQNLPTNMTFQVLNEVKVVSQEREIMKRFMKICNILCNLSYQNLVSGCDHLWISCYEEVFLTCTKCLLEQLGATIRGVKDFNDKYTVPCNETENVNIVKENLVDGINAIILQKNLSIFSLAIWTQIIMIGACKKGTKFERYANFIFDKFIVPSFTGNDINFRTNDLRLYGLEKVTFVSCSNLSIKSANYPIRLELSNAAKLRIKQIIVYLFDIDNVFNNDKHSAEIYTLMNSFFTTNDLKRDTREIYDLFYNISTSYNEPKLLREINSHNDHSGDSKMENALHVHFYHYRNTDKELKEREQISVKEFRKFLIAQYLLRPLNFVGGKRKKKINTLIMLEQFLLSCRNRYPDWFIVSNDRLDNNNDLSLSLEDLIQIMKGLTSSLLETIGREDTLFDDDIIGAVYRCGTHLLLFEPSADVKLIDWCRLRGGNLYRPNSINYFSYFLSFFKWLYEIGVSIAQDRLKFQHIYPKSLRIARNELLRTTINSGYVSTCDNIDDCLLTTTTINLMCHEKIMFSKNDECCHNGTSKFKNKYISQKQNDRNLESIHDVSSEISQFMRLYRSEE